MKKLDLIFPGTILYEEFMEPLGITAYKLSKEIKVQQTAISQIIKGSRRISVDMALRLSRYFSNSVLLRLFQNFSFWNSYLRFIGTNGRKTVFPELVEKLTEF